ncbi:MAG: trehalose-6-phosphate synthase [Chloroflexi bacterium]|nr:trehalose-6-phosphate synthase [Chloroflexota bacterium]
MNDTDTTSEAPFIVIVSNRGPFSFTRNPDGTFDAERGAGGLVTALGALAEKHEVLWVAAALSKDDRAWAEQHQEERANVQGIYMRLVTPSQKHYDKYYNVIANPLLWFIHHELWNIPRLPRITRETWQAWESYIEVNQMFAEVVADSIKDEKRPVIVLSQDYHLYMFPQLLREKVGDKVQIQPFVHIPWPGPDGWRILPEEMRSGILKSLLASDRIGFQTKKDAFNFVQTCRFYLDDAHSHGSRDSITYKKRRVEAHAYPISVDVEQVQAIAAESQTQLLKSQLLQSIGGRQLILRVDRVEPSKNILRGLEAYRVLLDRHPKYQGKVQMMALLVPSRMEVDQYQDYLKDIMAEAGMINAEYSDSLWEPVNIILGNNYHRAIAAMQLYDVLLVNPIADGMNLVAKEGALVNERDGVLLLSEYAGAFYEIGEHALTIPPFDIHSTAEAMNQALQMSADERHKRAIALQKIVQTNDVKTWFNMQVEDAMKSHHAEGKSSEASKK